ncbi:hypothetical protein STCU_12265 [Strigomonas culicis]|uniref:Uncharacterized protein n=1 Tax=Strigomonas culicis TaxID=28005 RepID=S9UXD5_9TRYP|nr:hypothetical protein STCU_12265 [Strigomonas culicis]|eukprot:EPY15190.1 hypothetical protein STCU_12265 [Strigomonas culicis]
MILSVLVFALPIVVIEGKTYTYKKGDVTASYTINRRSFLLYFFNRLKKEFGFKERHDLHLLYPMLILSVLMSVCAAFLLVLNLAYMTLSKLHSKERCCADQYRNAIYAAATYERRQSVNVMGDSSADYVPLVMEKTDGGDEAFLYMKSEDVKNVNQRLEEMRTAENKRRSVMKNMGIMMTVLWNLVWVLSLGTVIIVTEFKKTCLDAGVDSANGGSVKYQSGYIVGIV